MKIALFQMYIEWENKEENYTHLENKLKELHGENIDLVLLPEMSFTGFSMNTELTGEGGEFTINLMRHFAMKYDIAIGFGWVKSCTEWAENHYTIVEKDGNVLSDYIKIHPFSYSDEDKYFQGGREIVTYTFEGTDFSTFICYDLRFPEIFQIASQKADAIIVPANWPQKRSEHWKTLLRARAIENQVYIFAINCCGTIGGQYYSGDSCVINPDGKIESMLSDEEDIIVYEFVNDVRNYRKSFPVKEDRVEELYYEIMFAPVQKS